MRNGEALLQPRAMRWRAENARIPVSGAFHEVEDGGMERPPKERARQLSPRSLLRSRRFRPRVGGRIRPRSLLRVGGFNFSQEGVPSLLQGREAVRLLCGMPPSSLHLFDPERRKLPAGADGKGTVSGSCYLVSCQIRRDTRRIARRCDSCPSPLCTPKLGASTPPCLISAAVWTGLGSTRSDLA
jgi:hypothetical protein